MVLIWKLLNHNLESSGHNARSALIYRGDVRERLIYDHWFISEDTPVHSKMKTDYMQAVRLLTIELQLILRVDGSNNYRFFKKIL